MPIASQARPTPGTRLHRRLRRRTRRRFCLGAAASLTAVCVWLAWSIGGALLAPGTDPVSARLAEWARGHWLGWAVTAAEQVVYQAHKPTVGGAAPVAVPRVVRGGAVTTLPPSHGSRSSSAPSSGSVSRAPSVPHRPGAASSKRHAAGEARLPTPLTSVSGVRGEGQWQPLLATSAGIAAEATFVRPDTIHTSYLVGVVWMNPARLRFALHPGSSVPGPPFTQSQQLTADERGVVLATFNSGFRMKDADGGYWQRRTIVPLRTGAASMVFGADGTLRVMAWPGGTPKPGTIAVRQNLRMLVDHGAVNPDVFNPNTQAWGNTLGNKAYVWRSAIGTRADGSVVSVLGPAMSVQTLTRVLVAAGAVNAMELDINPKWTSYITYSQPGATPHKLTADEQSDAGRYLTTSSRDFVAVLPR